MSLRFVVKSEKLHQSRFAVASLPTHPENVVAEPQPVFERRSVILKYPKKSGTTGCADLLLATTDLLEQQASQNLRTFFGLSGFFQQEFDLRSKVVNLLLVCHLIFVLYFGVNLIQHGRLFVQIAHERVSCFLLSGLESLEILVNRFSQIMKL